MKLVYKSKGARGFLQILLIGFLPILLMFTVEHVERGAIGVLLPDAELYLSIADNFVSTGHFIQTARDIDAFVVPPGVPFILSVFRLLGFSNGMIIGFQAILFGASNLLLYSTEKQLLSKGGVAPAIYSLSYYRCRIWLGNIFVEHYFMFLLCLMIWISFSRFSQKKKITFLNITGLIAWFVRPILLIVYLFVLGYTIFYSVKHRDIAFSCWLCLLAAAILSINTAVNYRETGEFIIIENYSGMDIYKAASPNTPISYRDSMYFSDENYSMIYYDQNLSMSQKSEQLKQLAMGLIREDIFRYAKNAVLRFYDLFLRSYAFTTVFAITGGFLLTIRQRTGNGKINIILLCLNLLIAVITCFGFPEIRYSISIWALASVHIATFFWIVIENKIVGIIHRIHNYVQGS